MQFKGFENMWTPVAVATELSRPKPLGVTLSGQRIVLFRNEEDRLVAAAAKCPHRGVDLSLGRVIDGCVECPFHGWRFDEAGRCTHVPWDAAARKETLGIKTLPARELGGLLWVYTSTDTTPTGEPELPEELLRDDVRVSGQAFTFRAHWTRAVENMLDDSHLPFVHAKTIGRSLQSSHQSRLEHHVEKRSWGFSWRTAIDDQVQGQSAEFRWPNTMLLRIPVPGKLLAIHFTAVPVSETEVRILQLSVRNFLRWRIFDGLFHFMNRRVLAEDRAVIESSPFEVPPPQHEHSVRADTLSLAFRRRYFARVDEARLRGTFALP
jgi:phenylpropionate dioxygenase-like ring-hydroxylating dioxygenase large terminal subunit